MKMLKLNFYPDWQGYYAFFLFIHVDFVNEKLLKLKEKTSGGLCLLGLRMQ